MASFQQNADYEWFVANYDKLSQKYAPAYLVIKKATVLAAEISAEEAFQRALEIAQLGEFIIQKCDGSPEAYTASIASTCFL